MQMLLATANFVASTAILAMRQLLTAQLATPTKIEC